jgi:hypothetical protein
MAKLVLSAAGAGAVGTFAMIVSQVIMSKAARSLEIAHVQDSADAGIFEHQNPKTEGNQADLQL